MIQWSELDGIGGVKLPETNQFNASENTPALNGPQNKSFIPTPAIGIFSDKRPLLFVSGRVTLKLRDRNLKPTCKHQVGSNTKFMCVCVCPIL